MEQKTKGAHLKDEICLYASWQILGVSSRLPKFLNSVNDPVVFLKEESVYRGECWLHNGSCVPAGQIFWGRVRIQIFPGRLRARKPTLASAWKSFVTSVWCISA